MHLHELPDYTGFGDGDYAGIGNGDGGDRSDYIFNNPRVYTSSDMYEFNGDGYSMGLQGGELAI